MINKNKLINSIYLTEKNFKNIEKDLESILVWQEKLKSINTENVPPLFTTTEYTREFISFQDGLPLRSRCNVLQNASLKDNDYFIVPKIINK